MSFASGINRLFDMKSPSSGSSRRAAKARAQARRRRAAMQLEPLEVRVMLSTTYLVNTEHDVPLAAVQPGLGWDTNGNGEISLRSAIEAVNYEAANDPSNGPFTIDIPAGTYDLTLGELDLIPANGVTVTFAGQLSGQQSPVIDAQGQSRVLEIQSGTTPATIALEDLSLKDGDANNSGAIGSASVIGGGILDEGSPLTLEDVDLNEDDALATSSRPSALGGAIFDSGAPLTIEGSLITQDSAAAPPGVVPGPTLGGGIYDTGGTLTLTGSTVEEDTVMFGTTAAGGGIYVTNADAAISGSTIESNVAYAGAAPANVAGYQAEGGGLYFAPPTASGTSAAQGTLTIQDSQITGNQALGGAGGAGRYARIFYSGQSYTFSMPAPEGGAAAGAGVFVQQTAASGMATPLLSVNISSSTISGNSAVGGAGGIGVYTDNYDYTIGGIIDSAGAGGAGGTSTGAGLDIAAANGAVTITGSTISQNLGTGGAGGGGAPGFFGGGIPTGGAGGNGGAVQGVGLSLQVSGSVSVTTTTLEGNSATGGAGGSAGDGAVGVSDTASGDGGNGGGGGSVAGAALFSSDSTTNLTLSSVTAEQNVAAGGAAGAGGAGGYGGDNVDQFSVANTALEAVPIPGLTFLELAEVGDVSDGGAGGSGGVGGLVAGAVAVGGTTRIDSSAIVQNQVLAGTGGSGGNGGNGGNSATGASGGDAGTGGAAGEGGFAYGAGLTTINGSIIVTDSTLAGNSATGGDGGECGLPGMPGTGQPTFISDYFYPALSVLLAVVPEAAGLEGAAKVTYVVTELTFHGVEASSPGSLTDFLDFGALSPGQVGATAAAGAAALNGVAAGAGVFAQGGSVTLINDTITSNTANTGGGIYVASAATLSLGNCIVAQNTATSGIDPDVSSANYVVTSLGHNFIGSVTPDIEGFGQPGDVYGTLGAPLNPDLGLLQLSGGTTPNQEPMPDSLVLAAGSTALSTQYNLTTDQTGFSRSVNGAVDIGADEAETGLVGATLTVNSADGTEVPTNVLTLAEAVALTNGTLAYSQLTAQQQSQVSLGTGSGPDTIQFASSLAGQTISLSTAEASFFGPTALPIDVPVTIVGPSGGVTIARASSTANLRLFEVARPGQLVLENLTLSQGLALGATGVTGFNNGGGGGGGAGMGGAVLNFGTLTIQSSTLSGNSAQGGAGGLNGAAVAGEYIALQRGASGSGPVPGLAGQAGGFGGGGGGASFAGYGGAGGFGGGGGGNANKQEDVPGYTGAGAGGLGGGGSPNGDIRVGGGGGAGMGGAIFNAGTVTITGSTLAGNSAAGGGGSDGGGNGSGLGGALFNDNGTVTVSSTSFTGNAANQGAGIANVGDGGSAPIPVHTATLTLAGTTLSDSTAASTDVQEITINGGTATDSGSGNLIEGVPTGATPAGAPITLSAGSTSVGSTTGDPGSPDLWQITNSAGQTVVAAQNLTIDPNPSPVALPNSIIQNSGTITIDVTFQTTTGGVILGYQDQPQGTTPTNFVPALYVGTNGLLYAEISTGTVAPIQSNVAVNDGREHTAVLTVSTSTIGGVVETLTLDGVNVGILRGTLQALNMAFDQLGSGDTANWPGGNGGFYPFTGSIDQINITDNANIPYSAQQLSFTPTSPETLPSGLISGATALTVDLSFQTTSSGVILGAQNQPVGTTPTQSVPILYVGTNGLLYAEAPDGSGQQLVSTIQVNDGKTHQVVLTETAGNESLTLDGVPVGTLTGLSNPADLTFDQLGTGYTSNVTAAPNGFDPFSGTIGQVEISDGGLSADTVTFPASGSDQVTLTPPAGGTYTVGLQTFDAAGDLASTSQSLSVTGVTPAVSIGGLPGGTSVGTPIVLTASATDPSPANQAAGFNYLWEAGFSSGQTLLAGQGLSFTGSSTGGDPLALPNGLFTGASGLTVDITFSTYSDGVILGYQNTATSSTPSQYMPALYVGTDGLLYAEIFDGTFREMVSSTKVNDGKEHTVVLVETGSSQSLMLDGTTIATLSGTPNPDGMTFDELGTGYTLGHPNTPGGYFPFTGTIDSVEIFTGTAATSPFTFAGAGDSQATLMPPDFGTYTIGLVASDQQGFTGSTSQTLVVNPVPPTTVIGGLPGSTSLVGTPITLTASVTDPSPSVTAAGFGELWSVSAGTGQDVVVGQDLTFTSSNPSPINLPSGLIANAAALTVDVTFQTTADGVILGYQNTATSSTPSQYMPALYVGTDGLLYAEIFDGTFREIVSSTKVDDGKEHTVVLVETGSSQSLTLDGTTIATLSGTPNPDGMTFDQLGTGYTLGHPNTPGGYFPFSGTIESLTMTVGTALAGSVALSGSSGNQMTFTPPATGADTIALTVTDELGNRVSASGTVNASNASPITLSVPGATIQVVQGQPFSVSGSFIDTALAAGYSTYDLNVQYGDGNGNRVFGNPFAISHAYANAGDYTVTVNFSDSLGNTEHATFQVIVSGFTVNDGSSQPSAVSHLTYTFANPVTIKPGAFELLRNGRPSHIKLVLDEQPDEQDFLITFKGSGVVDGSLPDGSYTLITLHKKVKVLSGPPMTQNDVNKFVSRTAHAPDGKKDNAAPHGRAKAQIALPMRGPAKFLGRTVRPRSAVPPASPGPRTTATLAVKAKDRPTIAAIGVLTPNNEHHR